MLTGRLRRAWTQLPGWARWLVAAYMIGFADGTAAHARDLARGGLHAYAWARPAWVEVLFLSLVALDPLVMILTGLLLRAGAVLAAMVMAADLAGNWTQAWTVLHASPGLLARPPRPSRHA